MKDNAPVAGFTRSSILSAGALIFGEDERKRGHEYGGLADGGFVYCWRCHQLLNGPDWMLTECSPKGATP